jgi:hypothetical protein
MKQTKIQITPSQIGYTVGWLIICLAVGNYGKQYFTVNASNQVDINTVNIVMSAAEKKRQLKKDYLFVNTLCQSIIDLDEKHSCHLANTLTYQKLRKL